MKKSIDELIEQLSQPEYNQNVFFTEVASYCKESRILILEILESNYIQMCAKLRKTTGTQANVLHKLFTNGLIEDSVYAGTDNDIMDEFINQIAVQSVPKNRELQNLYEMRMFFNHDNFSDKCIKEIIPLSEISYFKLVEFKELGLTEQSINNRLKT